MEDKPCNNFVGTYSCRENLSLIDDPQRVFPNELKASDRSRIFEGLEGILPKIYFDKIWEMIFGRYQYYENL